MTLLPNELIETWQSNNAGAIGSGIDTRVLTGLGAIQCHLEVNGFAVLRWTQHHVQVAARNRNRIFSTLDFIDNAGLFPYISKNYIDGSTGQTLQFRILCMSADSREQAVQNVACQ